MALFSLLSFAMKEGVGERERARERERQRERENKREREIAREREGEMSVCLIIY